MEKRIEKANVEYADVRRSKTNLPEFFVRLKECEERGFKHKPGPITEATLTDLERRAGINTSQEGRSYGQSKSYGQTLRDRVADIMKMPAGDRAKAFREEEQEERENEDVLTKYMKARQKPADDLRAYYDKLSKDMPVSTGRPSRSAYYGIKDNKTVVYL